MRFFEFKPNLIEAKGVFGRKPGEPYIHQNGEKATFQQVFAIPDLAQGGKFESPEARDQAIAEFEKNNNASIECKISNHFSEFVSGSFSSCDKRVDQSATDCSISTITSRERAVTMLFPSHLK